MNWIQQPPNKKVCGQVAVAVVAGISLSESIAIIGKKGCTKTKDLIKALKVLGYKCPNHCKKLPTSSLAIAQVHSPKRKGGWHWVVVDGDKIFDGSYGTPDGKVCWPEGWRITSYLPLDKV